MASRTAESAFLRKFFPGHRRGLLTVCPKTDAPHEVKRLASAKRLVPVLRRCCFMASENLAKVPARTASSRTRSQTAWSKLRTPRLMRLCARGSGEDTMSYSVRRSRKRRAFPAIINCSAQEYDTSSKTSDDGRHCEKQEGGRQNSTPCPVEYSRVGSNTNDADPSVMVRGAGSVFAENTGPLVHETSPVPQVLDWRHNRS